MTASSGEVDQPPAAATLIRLARQARGLSPEAAAKMTAIRLGGSRWREIEKGYKGAERRTVRPPALTLAHMAHVVGVSPERLHEADRTDAAEILREILRQEAEAESEPAPYANLTDPLERAAWEADLPLSERTKMVDLLRQGRARALEPPPPRTDLSDLLRERRVALGLSLDDVSARVTDLTGNAELVESAWLDRLERAAVREGEEPEYPQLDALAEVLDLHPAQLQEAAGAQMMGVRTIWSEDGETSGLVIGDLDEEGLRRARHLMRMYGRTPTRDGQK